MPNLPKPSTSWGRQALDWWKATKKPRHVEAFTLLLVLGLPFASLMASFRSDSMILVACSLLGSTAFWFVGPRLMAHPRAIGARLYEYHDEFLPIVNGLLTVAVASAFPELKTALEVIGLVFAFLVLSNQPMEDRNAKLEPSKVAID